MEFSLFFSDLTEEAQERLLEVAGLEDESEANWDTFPITTIMLGEDE